MTRTTRILSAVAAVIVGLGMLIAGSPNADASGYTPHRKATAAVRATVTQLGPTQVINDTASVGTVRVIDPSGVSTNIARGKYVLAADGRGFPTLCGPAGKGVLVRPTDPYGKVIGRPVQAFRDGCARANAATIDADLVMLTVVN